MSSSEKLGIMQPGPPGTHRMVLDFSNIILGFDSMHATVERAEKMVIACFCFCVPHVLCHPPFTLHVAGGRDEGAHRGVRYIAKITALQSRISNATLGTRS
jgi:hypothetical protein